VVVVNNVKKLVEGCDFQFGWGEQYGICSGVGVAGVVRVLENSDAWLKFERTIM